MAFEKIKVANPIVEMDGTYGVFCLTRFVLICDAEDFACVRSWIWKSRLRGRS